MSGPEAKSPAPAGISAPDDLDVTDLFERLREELRRGAGSGGGAASAPPATVAAQPAAAALPDYFAFESRMRGSVDAIRERQRRYVEDFREAAPVLDIGCGRGELLQLLREAGVEARGIDADADMVAYARGDGLDVEQADLVEYLQRLDDGSLGGIFMGQVVEHLPPGVLVRSLELAARKLRPAGVLVAETINPLSPLALRHYFADLTHAQPLVPETLQLLARQSGFVDTEVRFLNEPAERLTEPDDPVIAANVRRLNELLFAPLDYALVARTAADDLVAELRGRGHETDLVTVPYKWYPGERVLSQAFLWRLLDLGESDGRSIDLVIATKFPSYAVRHPRKVVWLLHQFRQAYELDRTELGQFGESAEERATRRAVQRLDRVALGEARKVFATSRNVADRLQRSTGIAAEVMPHPPQELPYRTESYDDFVLSVGRLDRAKRHELLLDALATD